MQFDQQQRSEWIEVSRIMQLLLSLLILITLIPGHVSAKEQNLQREVFLPANDKAAIVIVVSGVSGPALYRDYSARLAAVGYYTILIDGKDILIRSQDKRNMDGSANLRKIISDAQTAARGNGGKVALVGFSHGGGGVLLHGTQLKNLISAVVAYYPAITKMGPDMAPLASKMQVPTLLLAGGQDRYNNCCLINTMHALESAARTNRADFELVIYPGADHGFNLTGPRYRAEDTKDAWEKTTRFLLHHHPPLGR